MTCDQTLYATGEPCGRSKNLLPGFNERGERIARCKRHAKPGYGWSPERPAWTQQVLAD